LGACKTISEPMVRLAQIADQSCSDTNTVSKLSETRFYMTHRVRPKNFSSLSFGANCTPRLDYHYLQIDQNELPLEPCHLLVPKGASNRISEPMVRSVQTMHLYCIDTNIVSKRTETRFHMTHSPRSSIQCVQHDFQAYGTFDTNRTTILRQD
jgi:hypothetical protein